MGYKLGVLIITGKYKSPQGYIYHRYDRCPEKRLGGVIFSQQDLQIDNGDLLISALGSSFMQAIQLASLKEKSSSTYFDAILIRKDPPFDMNYVFSTYLLNAERQGTPVLNRPSSIKLPAKTFARVNNQRCLHIVSANKEFCRLLMKKIMIMIFKTFGWDGRSICTAKPKEHNLCSKDLTRTSDPNGTKIYQRS